jgi:hypothetical protein
MKNFLESKEANFYHITTIANLDSIKENGLNSGSAKIFVARVAELSVLFAIALEQLPEIYQSSGIAILKLSQTNNTFLPEEIKPDTQARVEWTQVFQNIILRKNIPYQNMELFLQLNWGEGSLRELMIQQITSLAQLGEQKFKVHRMRTWAEQTIYL